MNQSSSINESILLKKLVFSMLFCTALLIIPLGFAQGDSRHFDFSGMKMNNTRSEKKIILFLVFIGAMTGISRTGQQCVIGTGGTYTLDTGALNPGEMMYLVVVGNNSTVEGSYGKNSSGAERPEAAGLPGCDYPQDVTGSC